jgi:hypothetical protein
VVVVEGLTVTLVKSHAAAAVTALPLPESRPVTV